MYKILDTKTYYINNKSKLISKTFSGSKETLPLSISGPIKLGTNKNDEIPIVGSVECDCNTIGEINIIYTPKDGFVGVDKFEYYVEFEDNTYKIIFNINIYNNESNNCIEKFIEVYTNEEDNFNITLTPSIDSFDIYATKSIVSFVDENLNWSYSSAYIDKLNNTSNITNTLTKTNLQLDAQYTTIGSNYDDVSLYYINNISLNFTKLHSFNKTEYVKVSFIDSCDTNYVSENDKKEVVNYIIRCHNIDYCNTSQGSNNNLPQMNGFDKPSFIVGVAPTPNEIKQIETTKTLNDYRCGNLFENTYAHDEFDSRKSRVIKIGNNVPENGVNLCYYENKVANMDDIVSIVETDVDKVSVIHVEDWVHLRGLDHQNEELFPRYIEFIGESGSEFENYIGTLYKEYVVWEEEFILDTTPVHKTVYQEYRGLHTTNMRNIPIFWDYNDGSLVGKLELSHSIVDAIDYEHTNNYSYPKTFSAYTKYEGLTYNNIVKYNGSAKYSGVITDKSVNSNVSPDVLNEVIMFPDESGKLYDINGNEFLHDDFFLITDKFVDGVPLYYKHKLKYRVYDAIGPNRFGVYENHSISLILNDGTVLDDDDYKWVVVAEKTSWENIYDIYVYTSFVPTYDMSIFVLYDGIMYEDYANKNYINPNNIIVGIKERLSSYEAISKKEYTISNIGNIEKQTSIAMNDVFIINDSREGINIKYQIIVDGKYESDTFEARLINYKYSISSEQYKYINNEQIISINSDNGFLSARDMFEKYNSQGNENKITSKSTFRIRLVDTDPETVRNKDKVVIYTDPNGSGLVIGITYENTGFNNNDTYTSDILPYFHTYKEKDGLIYKGYSVKCKNVNIITVSQPKSKSQFKKWLPAINYSYFVKKYERLDKTIDIIYSVPEYLSQVFSDDGPPYVSICDEEASIVCKNTIKTFRSPLYIKHDFNNWAPSNITVKKKLHNGDTILLNVKYYDYLNGIISTEENINSQDLILIDYEYEEQFYHYPGYYEDGDLKSKIIDINLNPLMYSKFTSMSDNILKDENVFDLFNKQIHFFLKPTRVIDTSSNTILEENKFALYHTIDSIKPIGNFDLHIGTIFVRHHTSLKSTCLIDSRIRGGGIIKSMSDALRKELEPESDFYLDIGTVDGQPYHENSVIIIKVDEKILSKNGGMFSEDDIHNAIKKWGSYGAYPIVRFVSTISDDDMPNNTMEIDTVFSNISDYKPVISCCEYSI